MRKTGCNVLYQLIVSFNSSPQEVQMKTEDHMSLELVATLMPESISGYDKGNLPSFALSLWSVYSDFGDR